MFAEGNFDLVVRRNCVVIDPNQMLVRFVFSVVAAKNLDGGNLFSNYITMNVNGNNVQTIIRH